MLELSAGIKDEKATASLQIIKKLKGRHSGDLSGAVISATTVVTKAMAIKKFFQLYYSDFGIL